MNPEEIKQAQEVFDLLDKGNIENIHVLELGKALRGLGLVLSDGHIKDFSEKCEKDPNDCLSLEEFRKIYKDSKSISNFGSEDWAQQIDNLDQGDGCASVESLVGLLTSGDEPLTRYEAELILSDFWNESSMNVNLKQFKEALLASKIAH
jgi:Ca2+-binding EF-hand superfamily protein